MKIENQIDPWSWNRKFNQIKDLENRDTPTLNLRFLKLVIQMNLSSAAEVNLGRGEFFSWGGPRELVSS